MESQTTSLYRAVCRDELNDLTQTGVFKAAHDSIERGKWFSDEAEHAIVWGERLYGSGDFHVIEARFPSPSVAGFELIAAMQDGIGPARFGELNYINAAHPVIREWRL